MGKSTEQRKPTPISFCDLLAKDIPSHVIAFAETVGGKVLFLILFAVALRSFSQMPIIVLAMALASFAPKYRWHITALATLALFLMNPFWFDLELPGLAATKENVTDKINFGVLQYSIALAFFLFAITIIVLRRRFANKIPFNRPILSLLIFYFILVICADRHILHGIPQVILWSFIDIFGGYVWFLGYALLNYKETSIPLFLQLGAFHPFWGSTTTPFGKGIANLRRLEVKTSQELALAQISGVKLIIECCVLQIVLNALETVIHSHLGVPTLDGAFTRQLSGEPYRWYECWFSLIASFCEAIMSIAISGNTYIACARMTGFQLLRNTYKPLQSRTIAEFWNRYYFYFKELLVEFFFYPTFLRCFKSHRRLRIVFSTFMAAGVGNAIFHFIRDIRYVLELGFWGSLQGYQTYLFYCLLLTSGIALSQLRPHRTIHTGVFRMNILPAFKVAAFFCFIYIFNDDGRQNTLQQHLVFLFHFFGLG